MSERQQCPVSPQEFLETLQRLLPLAHSAVPVRAHDGPCGPEAGCDATCMDVANCADTLILAHKVISKTKLWLENPAPATALRFPQGNCALNFEAEIAYVQGNCALNFEAEIAYVDELNATAPAAASKPTRGAEARDLAEHERLTAALAAESRRLDWALRDHRLTVLVTCEDGYETTVESRSQIDEYIAKGVAFGFAERPSIDDLIRECDSAREQCGTLARLLEKADKLAAHISDIRGDAAEFDRMQFYHKPIPGFVFNKAAELHAEIQSALAALKGQEGRDAGL